MREVAEMKKRLLSTFTALALVLALLPAPARAAVSCELLSTKITFTWTYYITYRWHGQDWNSLETASDVNYDAWEHMSHDDKIAVLRHFSGFSSQLKSQFSNSDAMLAYAMDKTGWRQLKDAHNLKMQQKYFPSLESFYNAGPGSFSTADIAGNLTAVETKSYQTLANEYYAFWNSGKDSYDKLVKLKNTQIANAVNAISSELIKIIMDNCTSGKPGGETLDDLLDATWEMLDENLEISDSIKKYTGIGMPEQYAQEFADKFTGEDDRIDAGEAIELIELINRLMTAQEKHATVCMQKCQDRARRLTSMGARYSEDAAQRATQQEADAAAWQQAWHDAANKSINLTDLAPGINVNSGDYDRDHNNALEGSELQEYYAACLSAAKTWAESDWNSTVAGLRDVWNNNWANETVGKGDARYFDRSRWYAYTTQYDANGEPLPNTFYSDAFSEYNGIMEGVSIWYVSGGGRDNVDAQRLFAEAHFKATTRYREALEAYGRGYQNAIDKLSTLKQQLEAAKQSYIDAWKAQRDLYIDNAATYRTRAYNLTHQAVGEVYGDWRFENAESRWNGFEEEYQNHIPYFARDVGLFDKALDDLNAEINRETAAYEMFRQGMEAFDNWLPQYFRFCAEVQTELVEGLAIVNHCLNELETQRSKYPAWVTEFNVTANINNRVGGILIPNNIRQMVANDYGLSLRNGILAEADYPTLENRVAPQLSTWLQREMELLNQIYRADRLLAKAGSKRTQDLTESGWSRAELDNLNNLPGVSHGVVIEPMLDLISHSDPYYRYANSLMVFDDSGVTPSLPAMPGYTVQLSVLYDDMMGNGAPMRALRARYAQLLNEKSDLLRVAYSGKLYTSNAYYTSKGVSANYFGATYPTDWYPSDNTRPEYWASQGSFRLWDLYNFRNSIFTPAVNEITSVNSGARSYNPVNRLDKGGRLNTFLAPKDGAVLASSIYADSAVDAVLEVGEKTCFQVTAIGEDEYSAPTYPNVFWSSSDESVVSVDVNGNLTALLPGTVTITATAEDSPAAAPITARFTVQVRSGECTSLEQLGSGAYVLSTKAECRGSQVTVTGSVATNDADAFEAGTVFTAVYDGSGRFLGCSTAPFAIQGRQTNPFSIHVSLSAVPSAPLMVKIFLMDTGSLFPLSDYTPASVSVSIAG